MEDDYKIIIIDSSNAVFNIANTFDFYVNLDEPLRNVYKINIITILADIPQASSNFYSPLDSIYVNINDYNRLISKKDNNNLYYFDSIIIENTISSRITIKNDYNTTDNINVYYLNPVEPQLKRFNIRILDKNNTKITNTNINRILIKLGVYYNNKKNNRI
jgi:hypothetical protein